MADGDTFLDSILIERENLRKENATQKDEHRRIVERLRSELEESIQKANEKTAQFQKQSEELNKSNQNLVQQIEKQTQALLNGRRSLEELERRYTILSTEKNNVVTLLETAEKTINTLRDDLRNEQNRSSRLGLEVAQKESQLREERIGNDLLKITERSLRNDIEDRKVTISRLQEDLHEKDRQITEARNDAERRCKEMEAECSRLREAANDERKTTVTFREKLRVEEERTRSLQTKIEDVELIKKRHREENLDQKRKHEDAVASLKEVVQMQKAHIERLETEKKIIQEEKSENQRSQQSRLEEFITRNQELQSERESREQRIVELEQENTELRGLVSALGTPSSQPIPPALRRFIVGGKLSIPDFYKQYFVTVQKVEELETTVEELTEAVEQRDKAIEEMQSSGSQNEARESELMDLEERLQTQQNVNTRLQVANEELKKNLRMLERENKKLSNQNRVLQADLARFMQSDMDDEGLGGESTAEVDGYRNVSELIETNLSLRDTIINLNTEKDELKERLEGFERSAQSLASSAEDINRIHADRQALEAKITELAREVQLYRASTESTNQKTLFQELARNNDMIEAIEKIAHDEKAAWSLINSFNGELIVEQFSTFRRENQEAKFEIESLRKENSDLKSRYEQYRDDIEGTVRTLSDQKSRLEGEVVGLKQQLHDVRLDARHTQERIAEHNSEKQALHGQINGLEREKAMLQQAWDNEKQRRSQMEDQLRTEALELGSVKNHLEAAREQITLLQRNINEQGEKIMQLQAEEIRLRSELRSQDLTRLQPTTDMVSKEDLVLEQEKHKVTLRALSDAKKQLDEMTRPTASTASVDQSGPTSGMSLSRQGSINPDLAMTMLRQSSEHQEELNRRNAELQRELDKARNEVKAKTEEMSKLREELSKKAEEISGDNAAVLKDLQLIKKDRERLQESERQLTNRLQTAEAECTQLRSRVQDLQSDVEKLTRIQSEALASKQSLLSQLEETRRELETTKESAAVERRRESDLQKALEDAKKRADETERNLRNEMTLLEQERENGNAWKKELYEKLVRPGMESSSSGADVSDEVRELTMLVEYQRSETAKLSQQLQLSKEQAMTTKARISSLLKEKDELERDLQNAMQRQRTAQSGSKDTHAQQKAILNESIELNARLGAELEEARRKIRTTEVSLKEVQDTVKPLQERLSQLENTKTKLDQENKTLKSELDSWNSRHGVQQQRAETESLRGQLADMKKKYEDQLSKLQALRKSVNELISKKTAEVESKANEAVTVKDREIGELNAKIASLTESLQQNLAELDSTKKLLAQSKKANLVLDKKLKSEIASLQQQQGQMRPRDDRPVTVQPAPTEAAPQRPPEEREEVPGPSTISVIPQQRQPPPEKASPRAIVHPQSLPQPQSAGPVLVRPSPAFRGPSQTPVVPVAPQSQASSEVEAPSVAENSEPASGSAPVAVAAAQTPQPVVPVAQTPAAVPSVSLAPQSQPTASARGNRRPVDDESTVGSGPGPAKRSRNELSLVKIPQPRQIAPAQPSLPRPASPTFSDVTSSTNANAARMTEMPSASNSGQQTSSVPTPSTSSGTFLAGPADQRAVPHGKTRTEEAPSGGMDSANASPEESVVTEEPSGALEERAVDSSANDEQPPDTLEPSAGAANEVPDNYGAEEEEDMNVDESGQAGSGENDDWQDEREENLEEGEIPGSSEADVAEVEPESHESMENEPLQSATISADNASGEEAEADNAVPEERPTAQQDNEAEYNPPENRESADTMQSSTHAQSEPGMLEAQETAKNEPTMDEFADFNFEPSELLAADDEGYDFSGIKAGTEESERKRSGSASTSNAPPATASSVNAPSSEPARLTTLVPTTTSRSAATTARKAAAGWTTTGTSSTGPSTSQGDPRAGQQRQPSKRAPIEAPPPAPEGSPGRGLPRAIRGALLGNRGRPDQGTRGGPRGAGAGRGGMNRRHNL